MEEKDDFKEESDQNKKKEIDILEMLHKRKMNVLKDCFAKTGDKGLDIDQFCSVMLEHLDYEKDDPKRKEEITIGLIDLFREIDVNGDASMEWEEFSDHIISLGLLRNDRSFKNVIKNYYESESIVDKEKHETGIEKVYCFDKLKSLLVLEKDSSKFKVYNSNKCDFLFEVNAHKCSVLAAEYLPNQNLIATSSNDLTLNFWDGNSYNLKQIVSVPEIQLTMKYAEWSTGNRPSYLYTGGSDAIIHIYDAQTLKEKGIMSGWNPFFKSDSQQYGHAGPIGDILPIDCQSTLVTAGLDANICLWDVVTHSPKKNLKGHEKGVYSLDWSDYSPMNQFLFSAGLDHECFVWNTYVNEKIFLLRGHNHPLVGVKCLPGTPQVVTADINGMVKIWDVRNFLCMQTINIPTDELNSFVVTSQPKKRIIFGTRRLTYFEYDEPKDQALTDEKMCLRILYNDELLCFVTLHPDCIKIWDARNGTLIQVFRKPSVSELTSCVLDNRKRKLFVGDSEGRIFTVNIKNGAKLKDFQKHSKLVTDLVHWTSLSVENGKNNDEKDDIRRIVSSSREETVIIHDEDAQDPSKSCRYQIKQHKADVNELSLKEGTELLASCSDDGGIIITNLIGYRQENLGKPGEKDNAQLKKILYLNPFNILLSADNLGNLYFFAVSPSKLKNQLILKMEYKTTPQTKTVEEKYPVTAIQFNRISKTLILGDEFGNIEIWDISHLIYKLNDLDEQEKQRKKQIEELRFNKNKDNLTEAQQLYLTQIEEKKSFSNNLTTNAQKTQKDDLEIFSKNDIKKVLSHQSAHKDGITWIEIVTVPEYPNCFATSSFDCCCHIWNVENDFQKINKIGSLVLGHTFSENGPDNKKKQGLIKLQPWELKINEEPTKKLALQEAKEMIEKVEEYGVDYFFEKEEKDKKQKPGEDENVSELKTVKFDIVMDKLSQKQQGKLSSQKDKSISNGIKNNNEQQRQRPNQNKNKFSFERKKEILEKAQKTIDKLKVWEKYKNAVGKDMTQQEMIDAERDDEDDMNQNFKLEFEKDLYQDNDEDEENDYHILSDLVDFKNQQHAGIYASKSTFKSKSVSRQKGPKLR